MRTVYVRGTGVVSPAGWGRQAFREIIARGEPAPTEVLNHPADMRRWPAHRVPKVPKASFNHPRLRRSSPITVFAVTAAEEALGSDLDLIRKGELQTGIIFCVLSGCVNYSRRFYAETLRDPATASPLIFPETVFNAPSSHLAAFFQTSAINYTLVGDQGAFLQGLALAGDWLLSGALDGCLVVGAEEADWITSAAATVFSRKSILSEGAGALYLSCRPGPGAPVVLKAVTDAFSYSDRVSRRQAASEARAQICPHQQTDSLFLCDSRQGNPRFDAPETEAWAGWTGPRLSLKPLLGDGMVAGAAWQCIAAVEAIQGGSCLEAIANVAGLNQQAIAALFARGDEPAMAEDH